MKVSLNIENDAELRAYIKDCVKGQVLSIVREGYVTIIKEEIERKMQDKSSLYFEKIIRDSFVIAVTKICRDDFNVSDWNNKYLEPTIASVVQRAISGKDWNKLIDDLAREKVKSLLK